MHERKLDQENGVCVDHPVEIADGVAVGRRIVGGKEEAAQIVDHDGVARPAGRGADAGHGAGVGDGKEEKHGQCAAFIGIVRGELEQGQGHGQHHGRHRVLADEGRQYAGKDGKAEGDAVGV